MSEMPKETMIKTENKQVTSQKILPTTELQDYKKVTNSLMQDALNVWTDLWAELDGQAGQSVSLKSETKDRFEPSSEFLEKMWVLRYYLDFSKRLSKH